MFKVEEKSEKKREKERGTNSWKFELGRLVW